MRSPGAYLDPCEATTGGGEEGVLRPVFLSGFEVVPIEIARVNDGSDGY